MAPTGRDRSLWDYQTASFLPCGAVFCVTGDRLSSMRVRGTRRARAKAALSKSAAPLARSVRDQGTADLNSLSCSVKQAGGVLTRPPRWQRFGRGFGHRLMAVQCIHLLEDALHVLLHGVLEMNKRRPICWLLNPSAMSAAISCSRSQARAPLHGLAFVAPPGPGGGRRPGRSRCRFNTASTLPHLLSEVARRAVAGTG